MKGATLADAAIQNTDLLYERITELQNHIDRLQIENILLKSLLGEKGGI